MNSPTLVLAALLPLAALASVGAAAPWKLVWSDEFDQAGRPDPQRWTNKVGFIRNGEAQYYTAGRAENARVENGSLVRRRAAGH